MKYGDIIKRNGQLGIVIKDDENNFRFHPVGFGRYCYSNLEVITEQDIEETTHEEKIKYLRKDFVWGQVVNVHKVGEYIIFEYIDDKGKTYFHGYINYKNVSMSYPSLDKAIIGTIAYKYDGANSQAAKFFYKMVGM